MKTTRIIILMTVLAAMLVGSAMADTERPQKKLPVGSYITSAKIEILSGDAERVRLALEYLSDLAYFYGPHSEAYFWSSQIYYDFIDQAPSPMDKKPHVGAFVAYSDSIHASCENNEIKKKFRKNCEEFALKVDSTKAYLWRQYYNDGAEKLREVGEALTDMQADPDTAAHAYYQAKVDALRDTAQAYFELSIIIDSADGRPWIGIGNLYSELGKLEEANSMLEKALPSVQGENKANMLVQIAYNYVNNSQYCESIEFFRQYLDEFGTDDVPNMINMSAIYNRCDKPDSAYQWYQIALGIDSASIDALVGSGRYHNQRAIWALDSIRTYREAENTAKVNEWTQVRESEFAQARDFLGKAYQVSDPSNVQVAQEYALVLYLLEEFEAAIEPFTRLTEQKPNDADGWATLGDCYLKLGNFDKCARAYEKVVEIEPNNRPVWESLEGLYKELKETANLKKAQEHLK